MRLTALSTLALLVGCGPGIDPLVGTYAFTMTGVDTNTAPNKNVSNATGSGTISITSAVAMTAGTTNYVLTVAQADTTPCVFDGSAAEKATDPEITLKPTQVCTFYPSSGTARATLTTGKAVLKLNATRPVDGLTVDLTYSYDGTTPIFNIAFAGAGHRTYTGTRR